MAHIDAEFPEYTGGELKRTPDQSAFDAAMNYFFEYFKNNQVPITNQFKSEANALRDEVNLLSQISTTQAGIATNAALMSTGTANNKGAWSLLAGSLNIPASVNHNGSIWVLNQNIANVTLSEPTSLNTDWTESSGVTQFELDEVKEDVSNLETNKLDTSIIHNATEKTTPVDADELAILDSANSFELKKLSWSTLKSVLFGSPELTGTPKAPTAPTGTNTAQLATTAFVNSEIANDVGVANSGLVKTALNASGTAPIYACRAWVNFNGTGTVAIRASGNVSSITDNGAGDYTVNFTTAMVDKDFSVNFCSGQLGSTSGSGMTTGLYTTSTTGTNPYEFITTSSIRLQIRVGSDGSLRDTDVVTVSIFR